MRGAVTLAAALALPPVGEDGLTYPRPLFLVLAFAVIVATLVIQGATLPGPTRRLNVPVDEAKEDALGSRRPGSTSTVDGCPGVTGCIGAGVSSMGTSPAVTRRRAGLPPPTSPRPGTR